MLRTKKLTFVELTQMLPTTPEQLSEQIKDAPDDPELIQLITEGPQEIRELIPLFLIPGLNTENEIQELARSLLLPTFCAVLPNKPLTIRELAEKFVAVSLDFCKSQTGIKRFFGVENSGSLARRTLQHCRGVLGWNFGH